MSHLLVFDPEEIAIQLGRNLANGLRMLADAIEAKQIDGRLLTCQGNGMLGGRRDTRAHVLVQLDLAVEVRTIVRGAPQLATGEKELHRCEHLQPGQPGQRYKAPYGIEAELCSECVAEFDARFTEEDRTLRPLEAYSRMEFEPTKGGN